MTKPPTSGEEHEPDAGPSRREQALANREAWVRVRETITGEHEVLVHDREEAVALREDAARIRAEADVARQDRERLLVQMREANERLVLATVRADALAEQADAAREAASEAAAAEAERRRCAEQRDRAKDDFLAVLGHELRNPLAPILIALDLIAMDRPDPHEREHAIIERQVHNIVALVDDLLDASRIHSGKIVLAKRRIEIADVVSRAVEMAGPQLAAHGHVLSVDVPQHGVAVDADPLRVAQVIGNLLTNAAKFTPSGGAVVVTAERHEATVVVRVRDTGIGLSETMLDRIFEPYAQAARGPSGLGLGLAIVRSLVELHGGSVTAHSEGLGRGSEFVVELPAAGE